MENIRGSLHQTMEGFYKVAVVDAEGENIIWEDPKWKKNLILNQGMDMLGSTTNPLALIGYPYAACFLYAIGGTGTRLNSISSDISTATQAGNLVTINPIGVLTSFTQSVGGYSTVTQIGDIIKYATGSGGVSEVMVTGVSPLSCSVNINQTISPGETFTIWKTSQTGLENEIARAGGYTAGGWTAPSSSYWLSGYCGTNIVGNQFQMYRTYDFGIEASPKIYTEIGVGRNYAATDTGGKTTFSRILLDTPVSIASGQRLRVAYQLNVNVQPTSSIYRTGVTMPLITGWPVSPSTNTNATESLQNVTDLIVTVLSTGASSTNNGLYPYFGYVLDPCGDNSSAQIFLSTSTRSLSPFGSAYARGTAPNVADYVNTIRAAYPGSGYYYCDKTGTFGLTQMNRSDIGSMGLGDGSTPYDATHQKYCMVFEQTQSKSNTQTLTLTWRFSWDRTLSNGA
jgi:hypothetical protein